VSFKFRIDILLTLCAHTHLLCVRSHFNFSYTTEASALLIEAANSYFHLYECGYHHNLIDEVPLTVGSPVIVDDVVEVYLGYYD
jgi:hypothetical protein